MKISSRHTVLRCAIYARVSSELQDTENSIDRQIRACREWAARNATEVLENHVYTDVAISGGSLSRPGLRAIIDLLRARTEVPFDALLVDDDSRLDRGGKLAEIAEMFRARDVRLISVDGGRDLSSEDQELMNFVKAGMNKEYLRELARRTRGGMLAKVERGYHAGGRVFGYSLVPEWPSQVPSEQRTSDSRLGTRIEINMEQAAVVRRIFDEYAEGQSFRSIAHGLNHDEIGKPNPGRGRGWDASSVRAILKNPKYRGDWYWNQARWTKTPEALLTGEQRERARASGRTPRKRVANAPTERVGEHREDLRIVSEELWQEVSSRFERRSSAPGRGRGRPSAYLLSGLMQCTCGGNIIVVRGREKNRNRVEMGCPRHRNRGQEICQNDGIVSENALSDALLGHAKDELLTPAVVKYALQEFNERLRRTTLDGSSSGRRREVEARIRQLEEESRRLAEALASGADVPAVTSLLAKKDQQIAAAKSELSACDLPSLRSWFRRWTPSEVEERLSRFREDLTSSNVPRARVLLGRLLGPMTVKPEFEGGRTKSWSIEVRANPLTVLQADSAGSNRGSGGGI